MRLLAWLLVVCSGCSLMRVRGPERPLKQAPQCTSDASGPVLTDVAVTAGLLAGGIALIVIGSQQPTETRGNTSLATVGGGVLIAGAVIEGGSAIWGVQKSSECRAALEAWPDTERRLQAEAERARANELAKAEEVRRARAAEEERVRARAEREAARTAAAQRDAEAAVQAEAEREAELARINALPIANADLQIENRYAESIFAVEAYVGETRENFTALKDTRIPANGSKVFKGAIRGRAGAPLTVAIGVMSLGDWRGFEVETEAFDPKKKLAIFYTWDMATAQFAIGGGWR